MPEQTTLDRRSLLIQLENYRLVFDVNSHLFEHDRLLREQICHRFGMLEIQVSEMELGERTTDKQKYEQALAQANHILFGIKSLIDQVLDHDIFPYVFFR